MSEDEKTALRNAKEQLKDELDSQVELSPLVQFLNDELELNKRHKLTIERRMVRSLNQRQRLYEPEDLAEIQDEGSGSKYYSGLTNIKCRSAESWILDVLIPQNERPFGFAPTPVPSLAPDLVEEITKAAHAEVMEEALFQGSNVDPAVLLEIKEMAEDKIADTVREEIKREGRERADRMEDLVEDQMEEGDWHKQVRMAISDFVTLPAAIMVAPLFRNMKVHKWEREGDDYIPVVDTKARMTFLRVSPFDCYPEGDSSGIQDGNLFLRMPLSAKGLEAMRGMPAYSDKAIDLVFSEYREGGIQSYLPVDQERSLAESRESAAKMDSRKIESWWFYGSVSGEKIMEWQIENRNEMMKDVDVFKEYEVQAIFIGRYVIKLSINEHPLGLRNVHKACYEEVPGAFWGNDVPHLLRHDQVAANQISRAIQNNSMMSSGFMMAIDTRVFTGGETSPHPYKVYTYDSSNNPMGTATGAREPIKVLDIPAKVQHLVNTLHDVQNRADENSGIPAYAHGDANVGGAGNTSSGLQMLMNASAKLLRMAIFNFDVGIVMPVVKMMYEHNMLHHDDPDVKGDLTAVFRGTNAVIAQEMLATRQKEFADMTANPEDRTLMGEDGRIELLRQMAKNLNLDHNTLFPEHRPPPPVQADPALMGGGMAPMPGGPVPQSSNDPMLSNAMGEPVKRGATVDPSGRPLREFHQ
jgi:hypothetical protein